MSRSFVWTGGRVAEALGLRADAPDVEYGGISTDTRTLRPGDLFVALRGERFDAHDLLARAAEAGAAGAVVDREPDEPPNGLALIPVEDTLAALGRLASFRRRTLGPKVVALTGSSGKTTTKSLIAAALGPDVYASPGNLNNLVGVPLSMLAAPESAGVWVVELASNRPGEIRRLGEIAAADVAVLTTVGAAHLEGFGDLAGVMEEKLSLLETVDRDGVAVVGDEPPDLPGAARQRFERVVVAGLGPSADVRPEAWSQTERGLEWRWAGWEFRLPSVGSHMLRNAMIALAVAREMGVSAEEASHRLARAELPPMRTEVRKIGGLTLLVDCYNANPASFGAALEALTALAEGRPRAAVVGTMLELGSESERLHAEIASRMLESGLERIAATGAFAGAFEALGSAEDERLILDEDPEAAYGRLAGLLGGEEVVLLKASRGVRLERLIPMFQRDFGRSRTGTGGGE